MLTATLMMVGFSANGALMAALAVEVSGPGQLNRGLSWLGSTGSAASIISFGGVGVLLEQFGERAVFALATGLALMAALWLIALPLRQRQVARHGVPAALLQLYDTPRTTDRIPSMHVKAPDRLASLIE